jgi:hypothetical protein
MIAADEYDWRQPNSGGLSLAGGMARAPVICEVDAGFRGSSPAR